jgi:hypothetical protein
VGLTPRAGTDGRMGHNHQAKKLRGYLGIKKFSLMNKALITKLYWRICNNTKLLVSKAFKSKYRPNGDLHTHKLKSHNSWIRKAIMGSNNPELT